MPRSSVPLARLASPAAALLLSLLLLPTVLDAGRHDGCPAEGPRLAVLGPAAVDEAPTPEAEPGGGEEEEGKGDDQDEPKWEVDHPPGPAREVALDLTEGTWISVDVAPDGRELVFDLLGDLYLLPIDGGEARSLTTGVAWDMQPRFSPDGERIAFTSDRAGGDNVWTIDRDGANPKAVTDEKFRLLNSPAWTPDGEFLVARKHFTSARSIGAGEIWLYHRSGGAGLQLTEKPNEQKDVGEPALSPDGRYVYFSQDTTPGPTFEYNKDPNPGIYSIRRLDRTTGELIDLVAGAGGAVRPTPSPDGKTLAFVRRVRAKTALWLKDLASGEERPLWDGLDRDLQETWAIHGVYPAFAWTPDASALVVWAGGTLHRVDAASGRATGIPFHVASARTVVDPLRFPVAVAPERFPVRMLRGVTVSPAGDRVVYQALGRLWVRELPDGTPRPLTADPTDHFEQEAAFSRDGRWIAFTTWDDRALGSIRLVAATGGASRAVVAAPGHYVEPAVTPDGRGVVFRRLDGGRETRSNLFAGEPGLFLAPLDASAAPRRLTRDGSQPHFGADPGRVYFLRRDGDQRLLASIALDGSEPRDHASSKWAARYRVSPDGRWLAWQERFHVYVTPWPATGRKVELAPDGKAMPVARATRDAGDSLHWSGDSTSLHWSLGPELFTRPLRDTFAFLDGPPEELPEAPATGRAIGFEAPTDAPRGTVALLGARVVTMRGDEAIENGAIVIRDNRIVAVGPRAEIAVPSDARVVDVAGKTILPGLIDVHWHGSFGEDGIVPENGWVPQASLAFGVTTAHDPSNDTGTVFAAAEMASAGRILAPRIFSTGTILYGAETSIMAPVDKLEDAATHIRRMKAVGAISVKSYNQPRRDQRQQVLAAAREAGIMVVPEGGSLLQHNLTMVVDGHTGVEHSIPVAAIYDDVRKLWGATPVGYTPTLGVGYGGLWGENYWYATTEVWKDERLLAFVPREIVDARARRPVTAPPEEWNHFRNARVAAELQEAGVSVQLGAHGQREGLAAHWELWMFVQGGMTPHQALRAGTLDGARYLGLDRDLGSIEPGKLADLLVLGADPLADIRNSRTVEKVLLNGRLYDAATMDQILPEPAKRPPFWWERGEDGRLKVAPPER